VQTGLSSLGSLKGDTGGLGRGQGRPREEGLAREEPHGGSLAGLRRSGKENGSGSRGGDFEISYNLVATLKSWDNIRLQVKVRNPKRDVGIHLKIAGKNRDLMRNSSKMEGDEMVDGPLQSRSSEVWMHSALENG
jgi:hypothetical protein